MVWFPFNQNTISVFVIVNNTKIHSTDCIKKVAEMFKYIGLTIADKWRINELAKNKKAIAIRPCFFESRGTFPLKTCYEKLFTAN